MSHSPILVIWGLGFRVYFADYSEENRELHEPQTLQSKPESPKPLKSWIRDPDTVNLIIPNPKTLDQNILNLSLFHVGK